MNLLLLQAGGRGEHETYSAANEPHDHSALVRLDSGRVRPGSVRACFSRDRHALRRASGADCNVVSSNSLLTCPDDSHHVHGVNRGAAHLFVD